MIQQEWLVTNGIGGYASGRLDGAITRRYHGLLIAALPNPLGRFMILEAISERFELSTGKVVYSGPEELAPEGAEMLAVDDFQMEAGLPVWSYKVDGCTIQKRVRLIHGQNTLHLEYSLASGRAFLQLRPAVNFRSHDAHVSEPLAEHFTLTDHEEGYELSAGSDLPVLRMSCDPRSQFVLDRKTLDSVVFSMERSRGYDFVGPVFSPGFFRVELTADRTVTLMASTESWEMVGTLSSSEAALLETQRRAALLQTASPGLRTGFAAELLFAADQFLIRPVGRTEDEVRARAAGDEVRTVIAGYYWFTDWGRDTMISLEGLTLTTGRYAEAGWLIRTFAHYVRDGLIPNMFPEGEKEGLYHTADASLWFFHAVSRYLEYTDDQATLRLVLPKMLQIARAHLNGTRFGIHVDPSDGLLTQGQEGYQLTWMDAKVGDWVVTPRRGKAVEINALWYNALCCLAGWMELVHGQGTGEEFAAHAARAKESFNRRFWCLERNHLYDVVDGENGDDASCRPNQVFAISLPNPVLDSSCWKQVMDQVTQRLLTPVGLRSLCPGDPNYKSSYDGDLRSRDAAYHQGSVWGWLIGPYVDAWMKVYQGDARKLLEGFVPHSNEACVGSISEIFDGDAPHLPRACIAQAWSVAEVLRCWAKTEGSSPGMPGRPV